MGERISREERVKGLVRLVRYPRHPASGGSWTPAASSTTHRSQAAIRLARRTCCSPVLRQSRLPGTITVAPEGRPDSSLPGPRPPGGLEGIAPREPKAAGADWTEERPREPKAAGADWTEERGTSDEGRRRLQGGRRRAG